MGCSDIERLGAGGGVGVGSGRGKGRSGMGGTLRSLPGAGGFSWPGFGLPARQASISHSLCLALHKACSSLALVHVSISLLICLICKRVRDSSRDT